MNINIRNLAAGGKVAHLEEKMNVSDLLEGRSEIISNGPLDVSLEARAVSGMTEVKGLLLLPLEKVCSRCLSTTQETLSIPFHESFIQKPELMPKDEPDDIHLVSEDNIELTPYVEETVSLALPYIPLCSETCKGLCPVCGQNRNEQSCGCKQDKLDPRLAGLADFFNK